LSSSVVNLVGKLGIRSDNTCYRSVKIMPDMVRCQPILQTKKAHHDRSPKDKHAVEYLKLISNACVSPVVTSSFVSFCGSAHGCNGSVPLIFSSSYFFCGYELLGLHVGVVSKKKRKKLARL